MGAYVLAAIVGALMGSFLHVVVLRSHAGTAWWRGRSQCSHCSRRLRWFELIPLVSYAIQRGRSRCCQQRLSHYYPLSELVALVAGMGVLWLSGGSWVIAVVLGLLAACLFVLLVSDILWQELPDFALYGALLTGSGVGWLMGLTWESQALGLAIGGGVFLIQFVLSRGRWVGSGDILLGLAMGVTLGWPAVMVALLLAYILGALVGLWLLASRRVTREAQIAFGPFLIIGLLVALAWSEPLIAWYLSLIYS